MRAPRVALRKSPTPPPWGVLWPYLSKAQSVDQQMRLQCGVGFRQLRTCRRTRQLCAEGGSRRSHSIAAPGVSDELISYYRERKTGEQIRSLRRSQPTIHHRPSRRATSQGERASQWRLEAHSPKDDRHWRPLPAQRVTVVSEYCVQEAGQHSEGRFGIGAAQTTRPPKESCAFR